MHDLYIPLKQQNLSEKGVSKVSLASLSLCIHCEFRVSFFSIASKTEVDG